MSRSGGFEVILRVILYVVVGLYVGVFVGGGELGGGGGGFLLCHLGPASTPEFKVLKMLTRKTLKL